MDEAQVKHLVTVLSNLTDASVDWAEVAKLRGISRKDNAATAFKGMMKKLGVDYSNNKFSLVDPAAMSVINSEANAAKAKSPRKRKPKTTEEDAGEEKDEAESPKKKPRAKKVVEKEQVKDEVEDQVKEDTAEDDEA